MFALEQHKVVVDELPIFGVTLVVVIALTALARHYVLSLPERGGYRGQLMLFFFVLLAVFTAFVMLPLDSNLHAEMFKLAGIVLSAALALSSTTFIGNLIAGGMLRTVSHFQVDDWIRVGEHFGRVTERGLLHTEIQTEDSDLTTLPNLLLATEPVTVVRSSGTIVSAIAGIGYDVPHARVEQALLDAAADAELDSAFVSVVELGDYAITYRVAGRLTDVDRLMSRRSRLRRAMLDALHEAEIEIMSPAFHNVLQRDGRQLVIPKETRGSRTDGAAPEDVVFEKAKAAKSLEEYRKTIAEMTEKLSEVDARLKSLEGEARETLDWERARIAGEVKRYEGLAEALQKKLADEQ